MGTPSENGTFQIILKRTMPSSRKYMRSCLWQRAPPRTSIWSSTKQEGPVYKQNRQRKTTSHGKIKIPRVRRKHRPKSPCASLSSSDIESAPHLRRKRSWVLLFLRRKSHWSRTRIFRQTRRKFYRQLHPVGINIPEKNTQSS